MFNEEYYSNFELMTLLWLLEIGFYVKHIKVRSAMLKLQINQR
jgi:hypothetical protein